MAEPTHTREELRRLICRELRMPFFRRFESYSTLTTSHASTPADTKLTQAADFWNNSWFYVCTESTPPTAAEETRLISDFTVTTGVLTLESALSGTPAASAKYEIHSLWSAFDIHNAINRAIEEAYPAFWDNVTDETLIIKKDTRQYALTGLTVLPWIVQNVYIENPQYQIRGTATAGSANTISDSSAPFSAVKAGWYVSIYSGTGAGQMRIVGTPTSTQLTVTVNWTTNPDTTSMYSVWDPTTQAYDWVKLDSVRFDSAEHPSWMEIPLLDSYLGFRLRIGYVGRTAPLTSDLATTIVPRRYIIDKAQSILYGLLLNDNRVDFTRYRQLEALYNDRAEQFKRDHGWNFPVATIWNTNRAVGSRRLEDPFRR